MRKYHINPATGRANICEAQLQCRFGAETKHYSTKEQARAGYEKSMEKLSLPGGARKSDATETRDERLARINSSRQRNTLSQKLPLGERIELLSLRNLKSMGTPEFPEKLSLSPVPAQEDREAGSLYFSEARNRLIYWPSPFSKVGVDAFTDRRAELDSSYKKIEGVAIFGRSIVTDPEKIEKLRAEADEAAQRLLLENEKRKADLERKAQFDPDPVRAHIRTSLAEGVFKSPGVLGRYDLDLYNTRIAEIRDSELSDDLKASAVYAEREMLSRVLVDNITHGSYKSYRGDIAEDRFLRLQKFFVVGKKRKDRVEKDIQSNAESLANRQERIRSQAKDFIKQLISSPYFTKVSSNRSS